MYIQEGKNPAVRISIYEILVVSITASLKDWKGKQVINLGNQTQNKLAFPPQKKLTHPPTGNTHYLQTKG